MNWICASISFLVFNYYNIKHTTEGVRQDSQAREM